MKQAEGVIYIERDKWKRTRDTVQRDQRKKFQDTEIQAETQRYSTERQAQEDWKYCTGNMQKIIEILRNQWKMVRDTDRQAEKTL